MDSDNKYAFISEIASRMTTLTRSVTGRRAQCIIFIVILSVKETIFVLFEINSNEDSDSDSGLFGNSIKVPPFSWLQDECEM